MDVRFFLAKYPNDLPSFRTNVKYSAKVVDFLPSMIYHRNIINAFMMHQ